MKKFNPYLIIGVGALLLSIIGLYNGYPLVYSDTGTYIYSGFDKFIPYDRPIAYGLFLRFFSFNYSAWFVIIVQNIITSFVIYETFKLFEFTKARLTQLFLGTILFLVFFTGIGWYTNQLMPDFLVPISVLIIFILILKSDRNYPVFILLSFILVFSLISHFSHLLIGTSIVLVVLFCRLIFRHKFSIFRLKRTLVVSIVVLSVWLFLPTLNYIIERQFILSKGSHVFLMSHLNDTGILKKFLDENCNSPEFKNCKLCQFKDSLPNDAASFIWSSCIVDSCGGWLGSKEEYSKIISATLTRPKYLFMNAYRSASYGLIQLTRNDIGSGLSAYNEGSAPYGQIHWRFNSELNNYLNSKQNKWDGVELKFDVLNRINFVVLIACLLFFILIFASSVFLKIAPKALLFILFVAMAIIANSFITAGLNCPYERYQARIVWLLPFAVIVILAKNYSIFFKTIYGLIVKK